MRASLLCFAAALGCASSALAQVTVVEQDQATTVVADPSPPPAQPRGFGRGIQYGAHLVSPIYIGRVERARPPADFIDTGPGLGVLGRIGWEFPAGITLEVFGGVAGNGVDTRDQPTSDVLLRADLGLGFRYMFWNDTAFVPFVELGGGLRWLWLDWPGMRDAWEVDAVLTGALHASAGAQIELTPWFGLEAGVAFDYTLPGVLEGGAFAIVPYVGVTLYAYDESGH